MAELNIGAMILNKRMERGYLQQALADKLNISFQAVSKWENGTYGISENFSFTDDSARLGYKCRFSFGLQVDSCLGI